MILGGLVESATGFLPEVTDREIEREIERGIERGRARPDAADGYVFDVVPAMMTYGKEICVSERGEWGIEEVPDRSMVLLLRAGTA